MFQFTKIDTSYKSYYSQISEYIDKIKQLLKYFKKNTSHK